jgi:predicted ATPase
MLRSIHIQGYRSLWDLRLSLDRVNVITGGNGVGKSNVYRSLAIMQHMAEGSFAQSLAAEGGMPSILWGGYWGKELRRIVWSIEHDDFSYEMTCGLIPTTNDDKTLFRTDPEIKSERIALSGKEMAVRKGSAVKTRNEHGKMEHLAWPMHGPESMLSELRESVRFTSLAAVRFTLMDWRMYHQFRTDIDAPIRRPRVGFWSPILAHDGSNLAATLQTIIESGQHDIHRIVAEAFPDCDWSPVRKSGQFELSLTHAGMERSLKAAELSDGTLRYFCLVAALLSSKPPPLLVLNEPESSLHHGLLEPLAGLIAQVPETTQIIVVTHSQVLSGALVHRCDAKMIELLMEDSKTKLKEHSGKRKVWTF